MKPIASFPSRTEQVYVSIRESICDGVLEPGAHLVQEDLAEQLGVSRQPVQQAAMLLKGDGLVIEKASRGLYVAPLDLESMEHRYQIRMVLDQLAARLVAEQARSSRAYVARLRTEGEALLAAGEAAVAEGRHREAVTLDLDFHALLYDLSANPLLAPTLAAHWHHLRRMMIAILRFAERGPVVWRQHREILETLASGDAARGEELVTAHVVGAKEALKEAMAQKRPAAESSRRRS